MGDENEKESLCEHGDELLMHLETILESDQFIDEVGFVHPSMFASLDLIHSADSATDAADEACKISDQADAGVYNKSIFWIRNHKLAISTDVLGVLYVAARDAFMRASKRYKASLDLSEKASKLSIDGAVTENVDHGLLEAEILKHTKALLIISCNFISAWNCRKLVLSRSSDLALFLDELHFSSLILSYSSKCESAWAQRRWVIKQLENKFENLQEIVKQDSELVKNTAEKFKMNYRAWSHRCWLIPYMTRTQVLDELDKSRKWAELHVADNCCFHFRRILILSLLENFSVKHGEASPRYKFDARHVLKEELIWNRLLIMSYTGREALWNHRRFLSHCWIKHFTVISRSLEDDDHVSSSLEIFLGEELQLLFSCLKVSADIFDDIQVQAKCAASYILWIWKFALPQDYMLEESLEDMGDLKTIMLNTSPENSSLWESLLN